jgi:predicted DNA-binding protein
MTPDPLSLDPKPAESKTRMISFRLTTDEYERFHALCLARGIHLSDVVRSAVNHVLSQDAPELYLDGAARMHSRIQDL